MKVFRIPAKAWSIQCSPSSLKLWLNILKTCLLRMLSDNQKFWCITRFKDELLTFINFFKLNHPNHTHSLLLWFLHQHIALLVTRFDYIWNLSPSESLFRNLTPWASYTFPYWIPFAVSFYFGWLAIKRPFQDAYFWSWCPSSQS